MLPILKALFPATPEATLSAYADELAKVFAAHQINTVNRKAAFLAQTGHESGGFAHTVENLNYSADRLRAVWPNRFNAGNAALYGRNPEKIANKVYADRMGNGPESSGDGWKYRGRGILQVTGKANYQAFKAATGHDVIAQPDWLATPQGASESAAWFWTVHNLNAMADKGDMLNMTKAINGGVNGLDQRRALYAKAQALLS